MIQPKMSGPFFEPPEISLNAVFGESAAIIRTTGDNRRREELGLFPFKCFHSLRINQRKIFQIPFHYLVVHYRIPRSLRNAVRLSCLVEALTPPSRQPFLRLYMSRNGFNPEKYGQPSQQDTETEVSGGPNGNFHSYRLTMAFTVCSLCPTT